MSGAAGGDLDGVLLVLLISRGGPRAEVGFEDVT